MEDYKATRDGHQLTDNYDPETNSLDIRSDGLYPSNVLSNLCNLGLTLALLLCSVTLMAQNTMRIHYKDGTEQDISIPQVDSVTFINKELPENSVSLTGSWLWGDKEAGYYEILTFNTDKTYTGYDNYFTYGFDTMTYGFFSQYGTMLTLWSNGFGYQHRYNWYVTGLTENALSVMTKMGPFTYYRLRSEIVKLKAGETLSNSEDEYIFADGVIAQIIDGKLCGLAQGETYIFKMTISTQMIWAYKVVVE